MQPHPSTNIEIDMKEREDTFLAIHGPEGTSHMKHHISVSRVWKGWCVTS